MPAGPKIRDDKSDSRDDHMSMTRFVSVLAVTTVALGAPITAVAQSDRVSGTVTYRERMALPPTAVVEVMLQDVSRADAPALVLASARVERPGQVPIRFDLGYNRRSIDPARRYAVRAEITDGKRVLFDTAEPVLVLTQGHDATADLVLVRVPSAPSEPERPEAPPLPAHPVTNLPATFIGQLPCDDCPGVRYHLNLFPDDSFALKMTRLGRPDGITDIIGTWALSSDRRMLVLASNRGSDAEVLVFAAPGGGVLRAVDDARASRSRAASELRRASQFQPMPIRAAFRGAYVSTDAGQIFVECSTGQRWPVAGEMSIRTDLENGYRKARSGAGAAVLVEVEGRVTPPGTGASRTATLVPERIVRWLPKERCAPRFVSAPLERTEWRLTHLGGTAVSVVADRRREPAIVFDDASETFSGSSGCNRLIGHYIAENATLQLEPGGTLTACRNEAQTEAAMLAAVKSTRTYRITGRVLEFFDEKGSQVARFEARLPAGATVR